MICMSLSTLKIRGSDGIVRELPPGEIFQPTYPDIIRPLVESGHVRIVQDSSTVMRTTRDNILQGGRWQHSTETRKAEQDMEKIQHNKGNVIDFHTACEKWKIAGTR